MCHLLVFIIHHLVSCLGVGSPVHSKSHHFISLQESLIVSELKVGVFSPFFFSFFSSFSLQEPISVMIACVFTRISVTVYHAKYADSLVLLCITNKFIFFQKLTRFWYISRSKWKFLNQVIRLIQHIRPKF